MTETKKSGKEKLDPHHFNYNTLEIMNDEGRCFSIMILVKEVAKESLQDTIPSKEGVYQGTYP